MMPPLALFAGQGELPHKIIDQCYQKGQPVFLIAFEGQTLPNLIQPQKLQGHLWTHFGAVGEILEALKARHITHIVMAGAMRRPSWSEIKLDRKGLQWLARLGLANIGAKTFGDDRLLSGIAGLLKAEGFEVVSPSDLLEGLLAPRGIMGCHHPDKTDWQDIEQGKEVVRLLGAADIGQAAVIQQGLVLGVEAIEGTEALLARCGNLRREGRGGVLVKMAKPCQNRSLDLPTIGVATLQQAKAAGLRGIAVEAGSTQILNRKAVIQAADEAGLYLVGVDSA